MNKILQMFIILLCSFTLCGYTTIGYSNVELEVAEDYDSGYSTMNTLRIKDKYITLPCKVQLFTELGFTPDKEYEVKPRHIMSGVEMYLPDGNGLTLGLVNNTDVKQSWENCDVYIVEYTYGGYRENEIDFDVFGIAGGDTYEFVKESLGEGSYTGDYDKDYGFTQSFQTPKWDREFMLSYLPDYTVEWISVEVDTPLDYGYESGFQFDDGGSSYHYDDYDDYTYQEEEYDYQHPTKGGDTYFVSISALSLVIVLLGVIIISTIIIVIVLMISKHKRRKERRTAAEMEAARRILNTELDDLVNDEMNNRYGGRQDG